MCFPGVAVATCASEEGATLASVNAPALLQLIVPGTDSGVVSSYATLAERARDAVYGFEEEVCVLDVETTGYDPGRDRLIEVAAAVMRGPEIVDRFESLVDPLIPIPTEITKLTCIDKTLVSGAPCAEAAVAKLVEFAGGRTLVAHNARFDRSFIEAVAGPGVPGGAWIDSLVMTRLGMPRLRSHRLQDLGAAFAGLDPARAHRAGADVGALCAVWRCALAGLSDLDAGVLARMAALAPDVEWPERAWVSQVSGARGPAPFDLAAVRRASVSVDRAEPLCDAEGKDCVAPDENDVAGAFARDGVVGRMYEGFEERTEQIEMARAVSAAFRDSTCAAIEAGTGVGKSVAYLVPAVRFALDNGVGVGVATKTNALMDQLVYQELPRLAALLDEDIRYVALKGYDHYLCLRKLERFTSELAASSDAEQVGLAAVLLSWTAASSFGDLDVVNVHWRRDVRSAIQASQADCTRRRCRYYPHLCYLHGVRRRAASAHVVVTNHALLFCDAVAQGGILPPIRHWIIDEAHAADAEARKQLSVAASHSELAAVLSSLAGRRGGLVQAIGRAVRDEAGAALALAALARVEADAQRCATLADSLFGFVKDLAPLAGSSDYDSAELWVTPEVRESGPWGLVSSTGASLARRLEEVIAAGRELMTLLEEFGADVSDQRADLAGLLSRLAEQHYGLVAVIGGEDEAFVYSVKLDRRPAVDAERFEAARLDVGEVLLEEFYPRMHSVVFTSATIATGESFEHFARGVGIDRLDDAEWFALKLPSSYDFERQMVVYVPTDLPEPRDVGYMKALERLLEEVHVAMGGSVLTLFTNRRDMERLHALIEPRLRERGLDVIVQRRGTSAKRLRDEFVADEQLSLMALRSFWEGFDAKGDTLRCVVVPKLPFGRPTDPLACERERREGRIAWQRYALPEAVIELKQAAGRLIRSTTDTGCLVIADARVIGKGYGAEFLAALPVADVERAPLAEVIARIGERFGDRGSQSS